MKKSYLLIFTACCLCFIIILWGCGKGPGSPASCGTEDTGIDAVITSTTHSHPPGDSGDVWELDLYMSDCDGEPEEWGNDYANIQFMGVPLYTSLTDNELYITNYRVTYTPLSPGYPPIDEIRSGIQGGYRVISGAQTGPFSFLILDYGRKFDIQDVLDRGVYPSNFPFIYDMTIEMWGEDKYGSSFCVGPIIRNVSIGPWDNC